MNADEHQKQLDEEQRQWDERFLTRWRKDIAIMKARTQRLWRAEYERIKQRHKTPF
jgi:cyclopropane fatty-acyl-phospholipid synthase-like methyltransferase